MVQLAQTVVFGFLVLFFVYRIISPPQDTSSIRPPSASSAPAARGIKAFEPAAPMPVRESLDDLEYDEAPRGHVPV